MGKDANPKTLVDSPAVREKIRELAQLISQEQFGAEGIPKEIKFSLMEAIGHEAGQELAQAIDQKLMEIHQQHFAAAQPCPQCGKLCPSWSKRREFSTRDGTTELPEVACYCTACRRTFFPSAAPVRTR